MATKRRWIGEHPFAAVALSVLICLVGNVVAGLVAGTWTGTLARWIDSTIDAVLTGLIFSGTVLFANRRAQP